jgi:pimeloyl-ACP methyl ester carboxylesterase
VPPGRDRSTVPSAIQRTADSTLHVIDSAAHMPNLERAEEFNEVLTAFLARLEH